jgi:hypothetical protein
MSRVHPYRCRKDSLSGTAFCYFCDGYVINPSSRTNKFWTASYFLRPDGDSKQKPVLAPTQFFLALSHRFGVVPESRKPNEWLQEAGGAVHQGRLVGFRIVPNRRSPTQNSCSTPCVVHECLTRKTSSIKNLI